MAGGVDDLALAHERERAVRERREVAGATERAVLAHDRGDAGVEHRDIRVERLGTDAGAPGRERRDAQEHERAHDLALDRFTAARGVRGDEAALQLLTLLERDVLRRERTETGRDAVVRHRVVGEGVDDRAALRDLRATRLAEHDARVMAGDGDDVVDAEGADADLDLAGSAHVRGRDAGAGRRGGVVVVLRHRGVRHDTTFARDHTRA